MSEQVGDHVDAAAGIGDVAGEGVPQLVRTDRGVQPGPARGRGEQLADRVRAHRRADRAAEQVHEHEVAARGRRDPHPLELVGVERLHRPGSPAAPPAAGGTSPTPRSGCRRGAPRADAPGRPRTPARRESASRCTSPRRSPHTSPRRSPARAISSTISRSRAERHARSSATISSSLARSTGVSGSRSRCRARIRQPIRPSSPRAAAGRSRSSATSYSNGTRPAGRLPGRDRVHHHAPHRGQHAVDPRRHSAPAPRPARPAPPPNRRRRPARPRRPARHGPATS